MKVRVDRVSVTNWRGIVEADVALGPGPVTWLIGRNGSGKSSLLDALSFVADVVRLGGGARRAELRGAPEDGSLLPFGELARDAARPVEFAVNCTAGDGQAWRYELSLRARGEAFVIEREWLYLRAAASWRSVLERGDDGSRWLVGGTVRGEGDWEPIVPPPHMPLVAMATEAQPTARWFADVLRGVLTLRLDPLLMRGGPREGYRAGDEIERHGRNLFAWAAARLRADPALQGALNRVAADSGLPALGLDGSGRLRFVDPDTGERPLWQASDGTLTNLALAALAVLASPEVSVVLLDEPAVAVDRVATREAAASVLDLAQLAHVIACTQNLEVANESSRDRCVLVERDGARGAVFTPLAEHPAARRGEGALFKGGQLAWAIWEGLDEALDDG